MDHGLNDVRHWLSLFQLQDYTQKLAEQGFTSLLKCSSLTQSHLVVLNVPFHKHSAILTAARNLQLAFPDLKKPAVSEDDPPPLPEKKNRKSCPSPSPGRHLNADLSSNSSLPTPPTRRSVLRNLSTGTPEQQTRNSNENAGLHLLDILPPPPTFPADINHDLIDVFPPPPSLSPPVLPTKKRQSMRIEEQDNSQQEPNHPIVDTMQALEIDDVYITSPPEITSSPPQRKQKPPVKPRPAITPRPAKTLLTQQATSPGASRSLPRASNSPNCDSGNKSSTLPASIARSPRVSKVNSILIKYN